MDHEPSDRRSFLAWVVTGLGVIFSAVIGAPVLAFIADPRNRQSAGGDFRVAEGVDLQTLQKDRPVQGVLRSVRRDAWTLHPNDVIGRVWIVLKKNPPAVFPDGTDTSLLDVFTTICPHLGCSVNLNADPSTGFTCPCHAAQFNVDGQKKNEHNPAQRGMDELEWKIEPDPANPARKLLLVKFKNFRTSVTKDER